MTQWSNARSTGQGAAKIIAIIITDRTKPFGETVCWPALVKRSGQTQWSNARSTGQGAAKIIAIIITGWTKPFGETVCWPALVKRSGQTQWSNGGRAGTRVKWSRAL